jgi:hypothetical protein
VYVTGALPTQYKSSPRASPRQLTIANPPPALSQSVTANYSKVPKKILVVLTYIDRPVPEYGFLSGRRLPSKKRTRRNFFSPSASGLMPGFATRKMSARPSDRFSSRIPHQSIPCVAPKRELVSCPQARRNSSAEQTIIALVLVAFPSLHYLFRPFFFFLLIVQ